MGIGCARIAGTEIIVATLKPASSVTVRLKISHEAPKNIFPQTSICVEFFYRSISLKDFLRSAASKDKAVQTALKILTCTAVHTHRLHATKDEVLV